VAAARPDLKPSEMPLVVGRIAVGAEAVTLQTRDDGRLDKTIDLFTAAAERTIPPAQPRTSVVGAVSRADHVLDVVCFPPPDMPPAARREITTALLNERLGTLWPETPIPWLNGKTPAQAARAGGFEVPLRAAFLLFEESGGGPGRQTRLDVPGLRARRGVPLEPPIDHASVVIDDLHLGRLALLDPKRLDDDRLLRLFERSREWGLVETVQTAARELTTRRGLVEREGFPAYGVYGELALGEAAKGRRDPAMEWARKGRAADRQARASVGAASWDMLELQIRLGTEEPETWVPELVVLLDRYERDAPATRVILAQLVQFGIVRLAPPEYEGEGVALDTTILQQLIARYGPRVQTAAGEVGVSAVRSGIWTPGGPASTGEKPRIILPGQ
jgi:hypothetical protein